MATLNDIASTTVGTSGPTVNFSSGTITVTVVDPTTIGYVGLPIPAPFSVLEVVTAGPQGPKGDQNVYTDAAPPSNPQTGWVWIPPL